jgi:sterol desaturase/sphingolipid hydroxylase (fatty acid hydroxylase superfamily)
MDVQHMRNWTWEDWKDNIAAQYADFPDSRRDILPTNAIESMWLYLTSTLGDFYLLLGFYCFMNLCYFIGGAFFYFCDKYRWLDKYKIQTEKYSDNADYIRCSMNLIQNYIVIIFPLVYLTYPLFRHMGFSTVLPLPSLGRFTFEFLFSVLMEDISHYIFHRLLHTPWLYKNIHKVHHTFSAPFGLAASYAHPAEVLILGFATFIGPLMIKPHFFSFLCWVLYRQLDAVGTHSGYDLPNLVNLVPFYGGIATHDYHHKSFIYNFSSRFTFMDLLFGTHRDPPGAKADSKSQ